MNSKMVKSKMVVLTGKEKSDIADANVVAGCMLQPTAGAVVNEIKRKLM
jgi:Holliday junction resolvasome RuvABC endonuclease subunit